MRRDRVESRTSESEQERDKSRWWWWSEKMKAEGVKSEGGNGGKDSRGVRKLGEYSMIGLYSCGSGGKSVSESNS